MSIPIKEWPENGRPYEKLARYGVDALSDAELLAILFRSGTTGKNSLEMANDLLQKAKGTLPGLCRLSDKEILSIPGIGKVKLWELKAVLAISDRMTRQSKSHTMRLSSPSEIASRYMEEMRQKKREVLKALFLDMRCQLLAEKDLSYGSASMTMVPEREIFVEALQCDAVSVILLHNHPSGDPTPSKADLESTKKVYEAGKLIGISLLDHIIIGDHRFYSLRDGGVLS